MSDLVGNPEDRFSQNEAHFGSGCTSSWSVLTYSFQAFVDLRLAFLAVTPGCFKINSKVERCIFTIHMDYMYTCQQKKRIFLNPVVTLVDGSILQLESNVNI